VRAGNMISFLDILSPLFSTLYHHKVQRILILGTGGAGQTSILHKLAQKEEHVKPLHDDRSFNCETVNRYGYSSTFWDVGGGSCCPLWEQFLDENDDGIIFVLDASCHDNIFDGGYAGPPRRFPHARTAWEALDSILKEVEAVPILILANKQDKPNALSRDEIIGELGMHRWPDVIWKLQPCSAITGKGLKEGLAWLSNSDKISDVAPPPAAKSKKWISNATKMRQAKRLKNITTNASKLNGELYLRTFLSEILGLHPNVAKGWLDYWVHSKGTEGVQAWAEQQNRISMGIPLVGSKEDFNDHCELMFQFLVRKDCPANQLLSSLEDKSFEWKFDHYYQLQAIWLYFRKYSSRRDALAQIFKVFEQLQGSDYNLTLTYFWVHMVDYSIHSQITEIDDFKTFLKLNPSMADSKLYSRYYDKEIAESDKAKKNMILPKKKALPSIVMKPQGGGEKAKKMLNDFEAKDCSDEDFIVAFEEEELSGWGHEYFIRVIFCYLNTLPRQTAIDQCFSEFESVQGAGYHLTLTFFWIQMVELKRVGFATFKELWSEHEEELGNMLLWREYYSDEVIDDPASASEMRLPDKKQIPSLIQAGVSPQHDARARCARSFRFEIQFSSLG